MSRDAECFGKTPYVSPGEAHKQLSYRDKRRRQVTRGGKPGAYKCNYCGHWHIGIGKK